MLYNRLRTFYHPERFQGWGRDRNYFEGWYFKVVSADEAKAYAIIPGIAFDERGDGHAFIQVLDGRERDSMYCKYPVSQFEASPDSFEVRIAENHFCSRAVSVEIPGFRAQLDFENSVPWPVSPLSPGIMGPYAFAPFMECYHGIVSMDHQVKGVVQKDGSAADFSGGRGYIEKDWGRSFPSGYVWMQSNHFRNSGTSFKASVARIPWIRNWFVGFIAGLWHDGRLIQFTTYNGSRLLKNVITVYHVDLVIENHTHRLEVLAHRDQATELASPVMGAMTGKIEESMTSKIDVRISETRTGTVIFEQSGRNAGLEVAGKVDDIIVQ